MSAASRATAPACGQHPRQHPRPFFCFFFIGAVSCATSHVGLRRKPEGALGRALDGCADNSHAAHLPRACTERRADAQAVRCAGRRGSHARSVPCALLGCWGAGVSWLGTMRSWYACSLGAMRRRVLGCWGAGVSWLGAMRSWRGTRACLVPCVAAGCPTVLVGALTCRRNCVRTWVHMGADLHSSNQHPVNQHSVNQHPVRTSSLRTSTL
eukprot:361649-Chlamydomonas_euryale.AAC.1